MNAHDPILAATCPIVGCDGPAQDRHDGYCSERHREEGEN